MKAGELLKLSTRTFRTRTGRTFLTILGISVGIGAILVFVSLGYGLQRVMLEQITTAESLLSLDVTTPKTGVLTLDDQKVSDISKLAYVEEVSPMAGISGQIAFGELTSGTLFYACHPSFFKLGGMVAEEGTLFSEEDAREAILSSALIQSFGISANNAIGREIKITLYRITKNEQGEETVEIIERQDPYKIVGIVAEDITGFVYIPINTVADFGVTEYSQVKVRVSNLDLIGTVRDEIVGMGYLVSSLSETVDEANKVFTAIQVTLAAFGLVALIVAAIGMANTMTVTLLERTNEIGVMKAIGATDTDIGRMFLTESLVMGLFGGIGGIVMNFIISKLLNMALNMVAKGLGGQAVSLFYTPIWFVVFIMCFSSLVGILSGVMPARRASKMNPLEALRYK